MAFERRPKRWQRDMEDGNKKKKQQQCGGCLEAVRKNKAAMAGLAILAVFVFLPCLRIC